MLGIDLSGVEAKSGFEPLPSGDYLVQCIEAKVQESKSGGKYIKAQFKVVSGNYENRRFFENFNIENSNEMAVQIGLSALRNFVESAGAPLQIESASNLEGLVCMARLKVKKDSYGEKNEVAVFKTAEERIEKEETEADF
jgi:hypothetical protein